MKISWIKFRILNALASRGLLKHFSFNVKVDSYETIKYIPILHGVGIVNLVDKEPWLDKVIAQISSTLKDRMFIDCGVNIGQTLVKVKNIIPEIRYFGFEPNLLCAMYAQQLISANNLQDTIVFPVGIADKVQVLDLLLSPSDNADTNASMINGFRSGNFQKVPSPFVDPSHLNIWEGGKIGCIKIDVEGGELEVIEGFRHLIIRDQPLIICEILPVYDASNTFRLTRQRRLIDLIKSLRYRLYRIGTDDGSLELIEDVEIHGNLELCNYMFAPTGFVAK